MKTISGRKTLARLIRSHVRWYDQQAKRHSQGALSDTWVKYVAKLTPAQWKQLKQGSSALPLHTYHKTLNLLKAMEETVLGKTYRSTSSGQPNVNGSRPHKKASNGSMIRAKRNMQKVLSGIRQRPHRKSTSTEMSPSINQAKKNLLKVLGSSRPARKRSRYVITAIKAQRRKNRVNVYVNGRYAFPAGINELSKYHLRIGMSLSKHLMKVIGESSEVSKMFDRASTRILHHLRTEHEIRKWLHKKYDCSSHDTDRVIKRLKDYHLIDDSHYASEYTRAEIVSGSKGPIAIGRHLRSKGVDALTVQNAVEKIYPVNKQLEVAERQAKDKFKIKRNVPFAKRLRKIKLSLARKGFSFELAAQAIDACHFQPDVSLQKRLLARYTQQAFRRYGRQITPNNHYKINMKIKRFLFRKGFDFDAIDQAIESYKQSR